MTDRLKVPAVAGVYRPVILLPMSRSLSLPSPTTISDREGRFQLKQLPDEPLAVAAEVNRDPGDGEPPHAWVSADLNQQDIRIVLDTSRLGDEKK